MTAFLTGLVLGFLVIVAAIVIALLVPARGPRP